MLCFFSYEIGLFEAPVHGCRSLFYGRGEDWREMSTSIIRQGPQVQKLNWLKRSKLSEKKQNLDYKIKSLIWNFSFSFRLSSRKSQSQWNFPFTLSFILQNSFIKKTSQIFWTSTHSTLQKIISHNPAKHLSHLSRFTAKTF